MWKIHVGYDYNSSLCLIYRKEECRKKEMCINEQSLLEMEALEGKTLFTETEILIKFLFLFLFSRRNLEKISFICSYSFHTYVTSFTHFTLHFLCILVHAEYFFIPDDAVDRRKLGF